VRHAVSHAAHYLVVLVVCLLAVRPLCRARWPRTAPGLGIAVVQALLLSVVTSVAGLAWAVGLSPYGLGELAALGRLAGDLASGAPVPLSPAQVAAVGAGLVVAVAALLSTGRFVLATLRARWRHRGLLALVGEPAGPGVTMIDHPIPAAYCLPGWRPSIVVSTGAVRALSAPQLAAVLAHERAHAVERHDLVVLPFAALRRAVPASRALGRLAVLAELLVEMRADDRAVTAAGRHALREALDRFAGAPGTVPRGALGAGAAVAQRIRRLDDPPVRLAGWAAAGIAGATVFVATTPLSLLVLPW
jgi:Zn-dependent protease with chaperone function